MDPDEVDLSVEFLYSTFQLLNTSEQDDVDRAQKILDTLFNSHLYNMVGNCAHIINCETYDSDLFGIAHAITAMRRAFDVRNFPNFDVIRERWNQEPTEDCKRAVVNACVRAMMFPDENIYTNAAALFGALFAVEIGELKPFEYIGNLISGEYGETGIRAGLIATREVCSPDYIDDNIRQYLAENIDPVFDLLGGLYSNIVQFEIQTGQEILVCLRIIAESIPQQVQKTEVIEAIVNNATELLPICQDATLLERMLILLERLVEANYPLENFKEIYDWSNLTSLAIEALKNFTDSVYIMNVLMFFNFLLKFEQEIVKHNIEVELVNEMAEQSGRKKDSVVYKLPEADLFHSFYRLYSDDLITLALELCSKIADDEQEAEDLDNPDMAMAACSIIRHLTVLSKEAYNKTVEFWCDNKNSDSWCMRHALVIIPYLIINNETLRFVREIERTEMLPYILSQLQTVGQIPRIIDSGLYSLTQIIEAFKFRISDDDFISILNILGAPYGLCISFDLQTGWNITNVEAGSYNEESGVVIANRVCDTLGSLTKYFRGKTDRLEALYQPLYSIIREIIKNFADNERVLTCAHLVLCVFIRAAPSTLHDTIMNDLFGRTIEQINVISNIVEEGSDTTATRTMMIVKQWVLQAICRSFKKQDDKENAAMLANFLIDTMKKPNMEPYHDDILQTLISVMGAMGSRASEIRDQIISYVDFAMQTMNSKLVVDTLKSLTEIVKNSPRDMESEYHIVIDYVMRLLTDEGFPNSDKPPLLECIGDILESEKEKMLGDPILRTSIWESILNVYDQITSDVMLMSDSDFVNDLYAGLYTAFRGILIVTNISDTDFINRKNVRCFFQPITPYIKQGVVKENMVWSFHRFLEEAIRVIGRKGNIQIARLGNFAVMFYGIAIAKMSWPNENKALESDCKEMIRYLSTV